MKHFNLLLIAVLLLALMAFNPPSAPLDRSPALAPVEAQNATVRIEPAESVVRAGDTFTVTVMIDDTSDLGGFEFDLLYTATIVTVDDVTVGDFPASTERIVVPVGPIMDNQAGRGSFAVATAGNVPGSDGTGVLATITLTAQNFGESPLDLQDVQVLDTCAELKTSTVENGTVRVRFAIYLPLILKDW